MNIFETLTKPFFNTKKTDGDLTNSDDENILSNLSTLDYSVVYSLEDATNNNSTTSSNIFGFNNKNILSQLTTAQSDLIKMYRNIAERPEVNNAIDEIVNEATYTNNNSKQITLDYSKGISENIQTEFNNALKNIISLLNFDFNSDKLFRKWYVDGKLVINVVYNNSNITKGIKKLNLLSPIGLFFNAEKNVWEYNITETTEISKGLSNQGNKEYKPEEIVIIDSGLVESHIVKSYLHPAIKVSNQLDTVEDLLIPLRFSRSVSRRVFNIDVDGLPYSKGMAAVKKIKDAFKYNKHYDTEKGTITNSAGVASIVEDYYLPKRSDKGSSIDVLEETGNLGETGDIEYFQRKLYKALKVPENRSMNEGTTFDFSGSQIDKDEKKFFIFISNLRKKFNILFIELIKRQVLSKGTMNEFEFNHYKDKLKIRWSNSSNFIEREELDLFKGKLDTYVQGQDLIGELFSKEWFLKNMLKFSDNEIEEMKESLIVAEQEKLNDEINKNIDDNYEEDYSDVDMETVGDNIEKDINIEKPEQSKHDFNMDI